MLIPAEHAHARGVHATGIDVVKHSHLTHHLATQRQMSGFEGHANNRCQFSVCMQLVFTPGSFSAAMSTHYPDTHQQQKHDDESVMLELGAKC